MTYEEALNTFKNVVDIIIGTNERLNGNPSTVIDITSGRLTLVREGSITLSSLQKVLNYGK